MSELTIIIDDWSHKGLEHYLMSLNGILSVNIKNEDQLEINVKYTNNLITDKIIKYEILSFLNILKVPSMIGFTKHSKNIIKEYLINRNDICCEYCLKGTIEDLFDIDGIESVNTDFNKNEYYTKNHDERGTIKIKINYDNNLISDEKMKEIEMKMNI